MHTICRAAAVLPLTLHHPLWQLVDELLDVSRHPRRPAYEMADDAPLVLHECAFPGLQFNLSEGEEPCSG